MLGVVKRLVCNYAAFSVSRPMFSHLWAALLESAPVGLWAELKAGEAGGG